MPKRNPSGQSQLIVVALKLQLLTIAVDKTISEGTLEVYLQNGSKNEVYFWGLQTVKNLIDVVNAIAEEAPKKPSSARAGGCSIDVYRKGTTETAKVTGATDPDDLESQGWDLVQSIPFDCGTYQTTTDGNNVSQGTNAYDAYMEFLRQANEYNSQNQGGTGGGNGTGNNGDPNYNPNATLEPNCIQNLNTCRENAANKRDNRLKIARAALFTGIFAVAKASLSTYVSINESLILGNLLGPEATAVIEVIAVFGAVGVLGFEAWALGELYWGARGEIDADYNTETLSCNTTYNCR